MGIADDADRALFVGNLDPKVTEEHIFELFLQAGPLIKVKIPKDTDGNSKQFAFVNFKHKISVPYALNLMNGIRLFGRQLNIKYKTGSSHMNQEGKSPANSPNSPVNLPGYRGGRDQSGSASDSPPRHMQRAFPSPDSLQRRAMMNNSWQAQQMNGAFQLAMQQLSGGRHHDWSPQHGHHHSHQENLNRHCRDQSNNGHAHDNHRRDFHHDDDRSGRNRNYPPERRRDSKEGRWKRF